MVDSSEPSWSSCLLALVWVLVLVLELVLLPRVSSEDLRVGRFSGMEGRSGGHSTSSEKVHARPSGTLGRWAGSAATRGEGPVAEEPHWW